MGNAPPIPQKILKNIATGATNIPIQSMVDQAYIFHRQGKIDDAGAMYQKILAIEPSNFDAMQLLGLLFAQQKKYPQALEWIAKAILVNPSHAATYNNLANILSEMGQLDQALASYERAIVHKPNFADAYYNRGNILKNLKRTEEALDSYNQAVRYKPNYPSAYNSRGYLLKDLGRFSEAIASYDKAISYKADYADAHNNRGNALVELNQFNEALASYDKAISYKADYADAHNNRGNALVELNQFNEALASYDKAISYKADYADAFINRGVLLVGLDNIQKAREDFNLGLKHAHNINTRFKTLIYLAIINYLNGDFDVVGKILSLSHPLLPNLGTQLKNERAYWEYLFSLIHWHYQHPPEKKDDNESRNEKIYIIGESHSLSYSKLALNLNSHKILCKPLWVLGCKQWHLANASQNLYKLKIRKMISKLDHGSKIVFAIGEIDCRSDEGILKLCSKNSSLIANDVAKSTIAGYLDFVSSEINQYGHRVVIQGVPAPNVNKMELTEKLQSLLVSLIETFNAELKHQSKLRGFNYLDIYRMTRDERGESNQLWHIDTHHISPAGLVEAFKNHLIDH